MSGPARRPAAALLVLAVLALACASGCALPPGAGGDDGGAPGRAAPGGAGGAGGAGRAAVIGPPAAAAPAWSAYLDPAVIGQGRVACLVVRPGPGAALPRPRAMFNGKRLTFFKSGDALVALIAVPCGAEVGPRVITVSDQRSPGALTALTLTVRSVDYPSEYLRVSAENENLTRDDAAWDADTAKTTAARALGPPEALWRGPFALPVAGPVTAVFGAARFVNGVENGRHSGLDIAAAEDTPVAAAAAGMVVLSDRLNITGETIIIAHGGGLFTSYCHLERRLVAAGERVARGQPVGLLGSTGFATGPHLHWGVTVGTTPVDPAAFLGGTVASAAAPAPGARPLP